MGTPLQTVYDRFFSIMDEDFTGQEGNVYNYLLSAQSRCFKNVEEDLTITLSDTIQYDGTFADDLEFDTIEYLAHEMKRARYHKKQAYYLTKKAEIGTKDFNRLEDDKKALISVNKTIEQIDVEIRDLRQNFYYY